MTDLLVVAKDICFGTPKLVQIDEHHNLEVHHGIVDALWVWTALFGRLRHQDLPLGQELSSPRLFSFAVYLHTRVAPEFSHDSGSRWFSP